jgi:hypothetical protein
MDFPQIIFLGIITQFWTLLSHVVRKRTKFVLMIQRLYNVPEGKIYFIHLRFSVQCERDALCVRRRVYIVIYDSAFYLLDLNIVGFFSVLDLLY